MRKTVHLKNMESSDTVRRVLEKDGELLVSFSRHAAYYRVPLKDAALCAQILEALKNGREIHFTQDRHCAISSVR
jgi:hypothetical protein